MPDPDQNERREPDLGHHPNVNREPLRTGNPPETQADQEEVRFRPPFWVVDRMSAGILMLIIVAILIAFGALVIGIIS